MHEEEARLERLMRFIVWGQLVLCLVWLTIATAIDPPGLFRFVMTGVLTAASIPVLRLLNQHRRRTAALLLVSSIWLTLAARVWVTGHVSNGAWFLFAALVGEAALFHSFRAAVITGAASGLLGGIVLLLIQLGLKEPSVTRPSMMLDWASGMLLFSIVGILQVAGVRLYRGGLEVARRTAERHRSLFDNTPNSLFELDLAEAIKLLPDIDAAAESVVVTDMNATAVRLFGKRREIAHALVVPVVEAIAAGKRIVDHELELELPEGRRRLVMRADLPEHGTHVVIGIADVTDQRRLAAAMHDNQRLETVTSLAGSVGHEFNNLLTIAQMNLERLAKRMPELADAREISRLRDVYTRAASATRQLLLFSRRDIAHRQVFPPARLLADFEAVARRTLDPKIELVIERTDELAAVMMDPAQLEQVISNLVANASAAMPNGGTLRITLGRRDGKVSLVVADTGAGMTPEIQARAFEPFFTTRPGRRAGLGLSIVSRIANDAEGTVELHTTPGAGTRVEVLLPLVALPPTVEATMRGSERILLVEDEDEVREVVRATLLEAGYEVTAVRSGDEALQAFGGGDHVDLVVSDLVMPGIGGRELVDRLRSKSPTLPVLYVSGFAADGPPSVAVDTGVAFLAKPFTADQLLTSVRSVLSAARL